MELDYTYIGSNAWVTIFDDGTVTLHDCRQPAPAAGQPDNRPLITLERESAQTLAAFFERHLKPKPIYKVTFDAAGSPFGNLAATQTLYEGNDETIMYSHVTAVEVTLMATYGSGEIIIYEHDEPRSIEYSNGRRSEWGER